MRSHFTRAASFLILALAVTGSSSCTSAVLQGTGSSFLIVDSLVGFANDEETGTNLQSDVLTEGSVIEDEGIVTFRLGMKDPGSGTSPTTPSANNAITISRFRVAYTRTDGRNVQGVDVPFAFEGAFTVTVRGEGTTEANFSLVRAQAKAEAPLRALRGGFGSSILSTIAEVTFYGKDQTGRAVTVVGRISVDFADFADPQ
ncbi:MAG: hypothetical protein M3R55_14460 [Acidobacteriota bacterium]|nr:hypothetical protein [Acidobacteriota bacterium]